MNKTCFIIAGPTASGKTAFAVKLAQYLSTEIISADSRQCYKELNIGVAKPSAEELAAVHHYFINSHSITDNLSAADYERYALEKLTGIFAKSNTAVVVGGTGLYIKALCEGLDDIPVADEITRNEVNEQFNKQGIAWLQHALKQEDPDFFATGEINNPHRMIRALEVKRSTGKSITKLRSGIKKQRGFNIVKLGLDMPRHLLYDRINYRVDNMIADGLVEEATQLIPSKNLNALQTVGYRELFGYFNDEYSLERAIELIKQNTRHYAKRQLTWFKKDASMHWLEADEIAAGADDLMKIITLKNGR